MHSFFLKKKKKTIIKPRLPCRTHDVRDAIVVGYLSRKNGTRPRERNVLQTTKLNIVEDLKSFLASDMEMQSLEFAQLVFSLAFVQVHFCYVSFPEFYNYNVCPAPSYMEGFDLHFLVLIFTGRLELRDCHASQKILWI